MTAKLLYEKYQKEMDNEIDCFNKGVSTFLLKLPIPMSYEVWKHLHSLKGDGGND